MTAMTFSQIADAAIEHISQRFGDGADAAKVLHRFGLTTYAKGKAKPKFKSCKDCPGPELCREKSRCGGDAATAKLASDIADALARIKAEPPKPKADTILVQMQKRAIELHPNADPAVAFSKSLSDPEQRRAYGAYRRAWNDEMADREAAVEAARRTPARKAAPDHGPAFAAIEAAGKAIRKAEPALSVEQSFAKAARQRPDLWTAYRQEQQRRVA